MFYIFLLMIMFDSGVYVFVSFFVIVIRLGLILKCCVFIFELSCLNLYMILLEISRMLCLCSMVWIVG